MTSQNESWKYHAKWKKPDRKNRYCKIQFIRWNIQKANNQLFFGVKNKGQLQVGTGAFILKAGFDDQFTSINLLTLSKLFTICDFRVCTLYIRAFYLLSCLRESSYVVQASLELTV